MSDKAILKEGLIDVIIKKLFLNKALKKDKGFQTQVKKLNNALADFEKAANAELKSLDPNAKPIKVDRYKI
tara:strand:- start:2704 stop:2916 length:213 start_codon:yes stop_codon:yes gene_type:complete